MARPHRLTARLLLPADGFTRPGPLAVGTYRHLADRYMVQRDWQAAAAFEEQALLLEHAAALHEERIATTTALASQS